MSTAFRCFFFRYVYLHSSYLLLQGVKRPVQEVAPEESGKDDEAGGGATVSSDSEQNAAKKRRVEATSE
jgi:hypothetical protein